MTDDQHPPEPLKPNEPVPEPEAPTEEWEDDHDPDTEDRPRPNPDEYANTVDEVLERRSVQGVVINRISTGTLFEGVGTGINP